MVVCGVWGKLSTKISTQASIEADCASKSEIQHCCGNWNRSQARMSWNTAFLARFRFARWRSWMMEIVEIVGTMMMAFYNDNPNTVDRVWQALLLARATALCCEAGNEFVLAHLGWERPKNVWVSSGCGCRMRLILDEYWPIQGPSKGVETICVFFQIVD